MNSLLSNDKEKINQIKPRDKFENIKSKFILKKLCNNLEKKKLFNIIKYNKNIKNRINININDYKEFSELYSSIEIEIMLVNNKYGRFINIEDIEEKYYHIYFNNNKEEIKRKYINKDKEIKKIKIIKIIIDHQIKSFEGLFFECRYIESINFKKFYRNNINNMSRMFFRCSSLKELNLDNFVTDNVTDMSYMFS